MQLDKDFTWNFDNFEITGIPYFYATSRKPNEMPDIDLKTIALVRADGNIVVSSRFTKKTITLYGFIIAPDRTAYENALDLLKYRLSTPQRPLVVTQAGAQRVYTASLTALSETFIEGGKSKFTFTFEANDPFGRDGGNTSYTTPNITTASYAVNHVFQGFVTVRPMLTITLNSLTGGTNKTITIGNSLTGQQIAITRNWTAGDVIVLNSDTMKVTVNGVPVDYTGFFPVFRPNTAYLQYLDTLTTRSVNIKIEYAKKYL